MSNDIRSGSGLSHKLKVKIAKKIVRGEHTSA